MLKFYTAGESHGKGLIALIEGLPAGLELNVAQINSELSRRQQGYGRGRRQQIETDTIEILSGVRFSTTTGAPVTFWIENKDYANWENIMDPIAEPSELSDKKSFHRPRPGHADLAGFYKYGHKDLRDILERSSARETAARVAAGAVAKQFLEHFGVHIFSHVIRLGAVAVPEGDFPKDYDTLAQRADTNDLRCAASDATLDAMRKQIDEADAEGNTLGGRLEIIATGVPKGLGSYVSWETRLDGKLAQALMSVQAVKGVSVGLSDLAESVPGNAFHDEITVDQTHEEPRITRPTNRAGGLEGGVTNGEPLLLQAIMKPISTMRTPLQSINLETMTPEKAHFERSDVTAVPACGVICEAMVALTLAQAVLEKYGGDSMDEVHSHYKASIELLDNRLSPTH
jgi:chorismate synthase